MRTSTWLGIYIIFYVMALTSILISVEGLRYANDLPCLSCPNGINGSQGEAGFCTNCCPLTFDSSISLSVMYWTIDAMLNNNVTQQSGWSFKNARNFINGGQIDTSSAGENYLTFPAGLWQLTYEASLSLGTTTILHKNYTGGNNTEADSLCGSTTQQTWISGISVQNMSELTQSYLFTTANTVARAAFPGPSSGLPLIRVTAIQYITY